SSSMIQALGDDICCISLPSNFQRQPSHISNFAEWKANQFRSFLLYIGPVVLKKYLTEEKYHHFLILHVAMRILLSPENCEKFAFYAKTLLLQFVQLYQDIYGK